MDMHGSLPFSKAFDFASGAIGDRFQNPFWQLKESILGTSLRQAVNEVKSFGRTIVAAAVHKRESESLRSIDELNSRLIDSLLNNIDDRQVVADAAMNYLSAGKPKTSVVFISRWLTAHRKGYNGASIDMDNVPINA